MNTLRQDLRVERTRTALLAAFRDVVLENRYEDVCVAEIAARAKVSRSALYQHFAGKDGLLTSSIAGPFSILADTLRPQSEVSRLKVLLEHFWANRPLARAIFLGAARRKTIAVLVDQIEGMLAQDGLSRRGALILPPRLAAVQLAEILLAPIIAWLLGESRCASEVLAASLQRVVRAALAAMKSRSI
jgi:AcrR family transcriptional regulator